MTYHSKKDNKLTLLMIINFYRKLLDKGNIKEGGAAHSRMKYLIENYNSR